MVVGRGNRVCRGFVRRKRLFQSRDSQDFLQSRRHGADAQIAACPPRPIQQPHEKAEPAAVIGAGGMGEVCRAKDTRLKREVAIKVLPDARREIRLVLNWFEELKQRVPAP